MQAELYSHEKIVHGSFAVAGVVSGAKYLVFPVRVLTRAPGLISRIIGITTNSLPFTTLYNSVLGSSNLPGFFCSTPSTRGSQGPVVSRCHSNAQSHMSGYNHNLNHNNNNQNNHKTTAVVILEPSLFSQSEP